MMNNMFDGRPRRRCDFCAAGQQRVEIEYIGAHYIIICITIYYLVDNDMIKVIIIIIIFIYIYYYYYCTQPIGTIMRVTSSPRATDAVCVLYHVSPTSLSWVLIILYRYLWHVHARYYKTTLRTSIGITDEYNSRIAR